jgi:hypothetical protein
MTDFPTEAKYMRVKNYNDKVLARNTTRITPFNGSTFGPNATDRILYNIPSETGMEIDMDTLMFHFDAIPVVGTGAAGTHDYYFNNSIESIIQTLRIRKGTSFLLEDIQRYNYLDSMFMNYLSDDYNKCVGAATMGIGSAYDRIRNHRTTEVLTSALIKRSYCIPLRLSGISNYSGLISTSLIDSVCAFQIEIELAPANQCMQAYASNLANAAVANSGAPDLTATYTINNCYMTYDVVRMAPEYHQQLQASIQRGIPLQIPYKTWRTSLYSLQPNTFSITFNINDTVKSLNAVYIAFFDSAEQGKLTIAGRDRKHFPSNLKSAQLQLGSFYYPLQPLDCENKASQVFLELQKALGLSFVRSEQSGPFGFNGVEFVGPSYGTTFDLVTGLDAAQPIVRTVNGVALSATYAGTGAGIGVKFSDSNYNTCLQADATALENTDQVACARFQREACQGCSEFMIGFNLRKVLDAVEGEIVGTDIQSSGSGLMTLRLEFGTQGSGAKSYNIVVASLYDAVLEIQSNQQTFRVE